MAAWPINPFRARVSEQSPLKVGSPYCSDPGCEYCKELREAKPVTASEAANGRLFLGMLGCLAEYEKELIRERTISGLEEARRRGVKLGPRPVNFDIARAKEMRSAGSSYASIAKALGVATGTIYAGLVSS